MADWIKLSTAMFDNPKIQMLGILPKGDSYIAFWVRLLCLAGKTNDGGRVYVAKNVAYTPQLLAATAGKTSAFVKQALNELKKLEMIEIDDAGIIYLIGWEKYQSTDRLERIREQERIKKQKQRSKVKADGQNGDLSPDVPTLPPKMSLGQSTGQNGDLSPDVPQENKNKSKSIDNYYYDDDDDNPISHSILQKETYSKAYKTKANNSSTVVVDSIANSNVFDLYSNNICPISPILAKKLQALIGEVGEAAVKYGIEAAVERGVRTLPYVTTCAKNYLASGGKAKQRPRGKPKVNDVESMKAELQKEIDMGKDGRK